MTGIINNPPRLILLMKVGIHGREELADIIKRKTTEEKSLGFSFWGYGGTLCHPVKVVQKFALLALAQKQNVEIVFATTKSPFLGEPIQASTYSIDNLSWSQIPSGANVIASKYALTIKDLRPCSDKLTLDQYRVALGPSAGKILSQYYRYRVDKAAASFDPTLHEQTNNEIQIAFRAKLVSPYAVFIK